MALTEQERAVLVTDIANLKRAMRTGAQRIVFQGRDTTFRSLAEMRSALADAEADLAEDAGASRPRQVRFMTGKGL